MAELREVLRKGRYAQCQFMTGWEGSNPPIFIYCHDPERDQSFVAAQRMGAWCEVDTYEIVQRLNGDWPEISVKWGTCR